MNRSVIALVIFVVFAAIFFVARSDMLAGPDLTVQLSSDNFEQVVTESDQVVVVDFGADW